MGMKKLRKAAASLGMAAAMLCTAVPVQAAPADQALPESVTMTIYPKDDKERANHIYGKNEKSYLAYVDGTVKILKSSNPSVAKLLKNETNIAGTKSTALFVKPKKAGNTTVSLKSKSKTYQVKVKVKKYQNPLSSVKIGNKSLKMSKLKKSSNYILDYAKFAGKKQKVSVKMASGWQLISMEYARKSWQKSESMKNGSSVTVKGGLGFELCVVARNKTTGQMETVEFFFV